MTGEMTFAEGLNRALSQAMAEDPAVLVLGENIRGQGRGEMRGLQDSYGDGRVIDFPISEAAMTGFGTGAALAGGRPVIHYQISSLVFPSFDQLVDQAAKLPLMLGGQSHVPVTYLVMGCGAAGGRAGQHSDNPYPYLIHAGIKSVMPATPADAEGLTLSAIREDDPVAVFVPVRLMGMTGPVNESAGAIPLAQGIVRRVGSDVTIVAVGHLVHEALATAETLAAGGIDAEVWDPRSLLPLDRDALIASVKKTGRAVLFDDSHRSCGFAAELSSVITETCFSVLKAPVKRVTRADVTVPFGQAIEDEVLPDRQRLEQAIHTVMAWQ